MGAQHTPGPTDFGYIHLQAANPGDERPCAMFSTTTIDAHAETHVMTGCLELERAARLRDVRFPPHAVGALVVVGPNVSLWRLVHGYFKARVKARAAIAKAGGAA